MTDDALALARRYVVDGHPVEATADRFGVDVEQLRHVVEDRAVSHTSNGPFSPLLEPDVAVTRTSHTSNGSNTGREKPDPDLLDAEVTAVPAAVRLSTVIPERVRWLWPGYLPRAKMVVIDGDPSTGKSTVGTDLAARTSTGSPWPDDTPNDEPGDVVLLSAEDGLADTIVPRLRAAGADLDRVHALIEVPMVDEDGNVHMVPPSLPRDIGQLERLVASHRAHLVIVDVLMAYLSGRVDSHRDQDVRAVLHQLSAMAERTGATVVLIRHLNKAGGGNALYRGGGSIGIVGAARAAYLVARDPDDEHRRIFAATKLNIAAEPPALSYRLVDDPEWFCARVDWDAEPVNITTTALLKGPTDEDERTERDEAADFIRAHLTENGGEAPASEVAKAATTALGVSKVTVHRARHRAGVRSHKAGMGSGWVWSIDPNAPRRFHEGFEDSSTQGLESSKPSGADESERRPIDSAIGAIDSGPQHPAPTVTPADPTRVCPDCGLPVEAGIARHRQCYLDSLRGPT